MPSSNWTPEQFRAHEARVRMDGVNRAGEKPPPDAATDESDLQDAIIAESRRRGWIALHGSMAHRTHRTIGEPDFICLLPDGVVVFIECKSRKGKLSPAQNAMAAWMKKLGHEIYVIRSLQEWLLVCIGKLKHLNLSEKDSEDSKSLESHNPKTEDASGNVSVNAVEPNTSERPT